MKIIKRTLSFFISVSIVTGCLFVPVSAEETAVLTSASENSDIISTNSYTDYLAVHEADKSAGAEVIIYGSQFDKTDMSDTAVSDDENAVKTSEEGTIEWKINIPETGMYQIDVDYTPLKGKGTAAERALYIDGELPFDDARFISLAHAWQDASSEFPEDAAGNQLRPEQTEIFRRTTVSLRDSMGYHLLPFKFYFTAGEHVIKLESIRESLIIHSLKLHNKPQPISYAQYDKQHPKTPGNDNRSFEAEHSLEKSDFSIYPYNDHDSYYTSPQDEKKLLLNCIGGTKWQDAGGWISWNIEIETAGRYHILPRVRQNIKSGTFVSRAIYIDGELPFAEAGSTRFVFTDKWVQEPLGYDGTTFEFYFEPGTYTLTMEVTLGDLAPLISEADSVLQELNSIYREILMITGPSPDIYRDYEFENMIPDTLKNIELQQKRLSDVSSKLQKVTNRRGEEIAILDRLGFQMGEMVEDPTVIAEAFSSFAGNISALGTWVLNARQQPLELDKIAIVPSDGEPDEEPYSILKQLWFAVKCFFVSFFVDYNMIGSEDSGSPVNVWVATGRDQAQIIKSLSEDTFKKQFGADANIKLVAAGTLLPSVLAGIGPDVSLFNPCNDPINYATRGAVVELSGFKGFDNVISRFPAAATQSYEYEGGTYALPETVVFPMLFYRKDIFESMSLAVPETWKEFYAIIPELQKKNMQVGFPINLTGLKIFLYQSGDSLFNKDLTESTIDSDATLDAFVNMMDLFTAYQFPAAYDLANRFRTGEMPMAIADYTLCNQLSVFAPEIRGQWEFVPLPGVVKDDGSIDNGSPVSTVGASSALGAGTVLAAAPSTGAMMMTSASDRDKAFDFLDWWTSDDTQIRFCTEMEAVLGVAAKQPTANINALARLPWTTAEYKNLSSQFESLYGTPEVPGGYYIARYYDFAFNNVYTNKQPAVQSLIKYKNIINDEITRKRHEFGLN